MWTIIRTKLIVPNNRNDIEKVKACGVRGVLIGEGLVKATDIPSAVKEFLLQ